MDAQPQGDLHLSTQGDLPHSNLIESALSRRGFLRGAALTGGGLLAAGLAACAPTSAVPTWTYAPPAAGGAAPSGAPSSAGPAASGMVMPSAAASVAPPASAAPGGPIPAGWTQHDVEARTVVRRYLGNLAPALKDVYGDAAFAKLAEILGAADGYPELKLKPSFVQVPQLVLDDVLKPLKPELDGNVKVFRLTIDEINQSIDELKPPVAALGYNGQWPGPTIKVTEGDKVRVTFTNNLKETTGVHFHGVEFDDFFQDGIPFVTQLPIIPGGTWTYEFSASRPGSLMYHSTTTPPTRSGGAFSGPSSSSRGRRRRTTRSTATTPGSRTTRSAGSRSTATAFRPSSRSSPPRARQSGSGS